VPPKTASRIYRSTYEWGDDGWVERRRAADALKEPLSIYEVHAESWRLGLKWKELATSSFPTPTISASPTSSCCR
jgi:1,4-alpha-glucan branching enzyme